MHFEYFFPANGLLFARHR